MLALPQRTDLQRWTPNLLTASRIPLSVAFYWLTIREHYIASLGALVAAQITDWVDGALARRWKAQTPFGAKAERFADTFMLAAAGLAMTQAGLLPAWVLIGGSAYWVFTWAAPRWIRRLWLLNAVLGMRTLFYGASLAAIPLLLLKTIGSSQPVAAWAMLSAFIVYGLVTLYWKRRRIHYYWQRFLERLRVAALRIE